ncbi:hypothetical protein F4781DRAFT_428900 [Annulohypoxylon bovei var. microspora]|nr:hypothetical protein F4781DRAFT_428900 [Annulohypoxylon bovei var. microspora]
MAMKSWTFKDGFQLPVGTQLSFPTQQYSNDADVHPNPDVFDAKRHLRKREIDPAKYHFASTADTLIWGSGRHACPGRFLYPEEGEVRPNPDMLNDIMTAPDVTMSILFKEGA